MKLLLPDNIFAKLFLLNLPDEIKKEAVFAPASVISSKLQDGSADIGIIPSLDLVKHQDFFVSGRHAISFDSNLSNSYLYFQPDKDKLKEIYYAGDVSVNEILLSTILFKEKYGMDIEAHLESESVNIEEKNYLLAGDINLKDNMLKHQFSFSDELSNMIELPYVNFVIASPIEENVEKFSEPLENIDKTIDDKKEEFLDGFNLEENTRDFLLCNMNSVYYEITESEQEGLMELLRLPYYHGSVEEMFEIKLV